MGLHEVIFYSSPDTPFTMASAALGKVMSWDLARAYRFCKEAHENGTCLLCICSKEQARKYVLDMEEHSLIGEQVPI